MKWNKQAELIKQLSDRQLVSQVYATQALLFSIALGAMWVLFDSFTDVQALFVWNVSTVIQFGVSAAVFILLVDIILMKVLPKSYYDDGGINERVFRSISIPEIAIIAFVVAFSEELLFRGVLHTEFGYVLASVAFALMHIRYLTKPVLLVSVLLISFYLGLMYEWTGELWVTIVAHFLIDLVLGLMIRLKWMR
ncbi:lysostaphin resistance A-like protein [Pontibacillus salicampi]|uniref:Lysostaphin resistance A-like protein n=1 Tax=Pontibacillus salicampi TaxID=1449801 RepID=A0ABV6LL97_9BACI